MNPLYVSHNSIESCIRECSEEEGVNDETVCEFPYGLDMPGEKERAEFIVRACNSHDELVAAARNTVGYYVATQPGRICLNDELNPCGGLRHWGGGAACPLCSARAALAKADAL